MQSDIASQKYVLKPHPIDIKGGFCLPSGCLIDELLLRSFRFSVQQVPNRAHSVFQCGPCDG